jgi:hypothetical protein
MEPPNQLHDKIDQFESCGVKPLQEINSSFVYLMLMKHLLRNPKHFDV